LAFWSLVGPVGPVGLGLLTGLTRFTRLAGLVIGLLGEDVAVAGVDLDLVGLAVVTLDLNLVDYVAVLVSELGVRYLAGDGLQSGLLGGLLVDLGERLELLRLGRLGLLLRSLALLRLLAFGGLLVSTLREGLYGTLVGGILLLLPALLLTLLGCGLAAALGGRLGSGRHCGTATNGEYRRRYRSRCSFLHVHSLSPSLFSVVSIVCVVYDCLWNVSRSSHFSLHRNLHWDPLVWISARLLTIPSIAG
jgi:hypothetical protein